MAVEAFNRSEPANPHIYSRGLHSPFSPNFGSSGSVTFISNFSVNETNQEKKHQETARIFEPKPLTHNQIKERLACSNFTE
jgi:hypothetical protein